MGIRDLLNVKGSVEIKVWKREVRDSEKSSPISTFKTPAWWTSQSLQFIKKPSTSGCQSATAKGGLVVRSMEIAASGKLLPHVATAFVDSQSSTW